MVLDSLDRKSLMTNAFDGSVIDASVGDFDAFRKVVIGDRIAMVLAGDIDAARAKILDRVVRSAMPEGQLEGVTAQGGSPGPGERKMPSGFPASSSSADVCAGKTWTVQSLAASETRIFFFRPQSSRET